MRTLLVALSALLVLLVAGQILLAAYSALGSAPVEESFGLHSTMGFVTVFVAILLLVCAALARSSRPLMVSASVVTGLVLLQLVLGTFSNGESTGEAVRMVFALHGLNAFVLAVGSVHLVQRALADRSTHRTGTTDTPVDVTTSN